MMKQLNPYIEVIAIVSVAILLLLILHAPNGEIVFLLIFGGMIMGALLFSYCYIKTRKNKIQNTGPVLDIEGKPLDPDASYRLVLRKTPTIPYMYQETSVIFNGSDLQKWDPQWFEGFVPVRHFSLDI